MYKLSYEKCVCFIFLVILVFISCSGFHTDRLVTLTDQNKKYPFTSSSYSLNENAQYESDFVTRMINSNRAIENRKLYVRDVHFAGMPGVGVSLTEGIDHRHPQRQRQQQQHHNRRTRRHDLRRAYERRRKRREALLTAAYAPLQTRNNENSINPTPRRHQKHMDVATTTTTTTTTHIVNVQQHPRVVVTEHEPSSVLVRERRAAGQKPAGDNRKKDKKFCPGQDVGTRAYYAKTIIEGRLRSKSSTTNKKTYYVTVEVKRIYKNESNFRALNITEKIRLHFANGRYKGCDRKLADGLVKAQLVNGKDYIFFLQSLGPHNYTVLGPPEPLEAKKVKAIKDIINNKKVKDARINVRLTNKTVKVNDILRLTCGVRGNPPPVVTWYKDGREIRGKRKRPRIKHMEKKSVLSIQNVDSSDAGKYECRAKGVIGKVVSSSALVTIQQDTTTTTTTTVPTDTEGSRVPCGSPQNEELCLNGGTCFFYTILGEMGCRCGEDYTGHRCENKAVSGKSSETQSGEESK